jgi:hypothetical protein
LGQPSLVDSIHFTIFQSWRLFFCKRLARESPEKILTSRWDQNAFTTGDLSGHHRRTRVWRRVSCISSLNWRNSIKRNGETTDYINSQKRPIYSRSIRTW